MRRPFPIVRRMSGMIAERNNFALRRRRQIVRFEFDRLVDNRRLFHRRHRPRSVQNPMLRRMMNSRLRVRMDTRRMRSCRGSDMRALSVSQTRSWFVHKATSICQPPPWICRPQYNTIHLHWPSQIPIAFHEEFCYPLVGNNLAVGASCAIGSILTHIDTGGRHMKFGPTTIAVALAISLTISLPSSLFAKGKKGGGGGQQSQQQQQPQQNTNAYTPPTTAPAPPPDDLTKAQIAMQVAEKKVKTTFEANDDWKTASDSLTQAHTAYNTASANTGANLKANPDYVAAVAAKTKAVADLEALRDSGNATDDQLAAAVTASMNARSAVTKLEHSAKDNDPTIVDAKAKLATATAAMDDQRKKEDAAVQADPDWIAAKKDYDDAKSKLASAAGH